jgi:hypothetical protein
MDQPVRPTHRTAQRSAYGILVYWALNGTLLFAEAQWHVLSRLTAWDIGQFSSLVPLLGKLAHVGFAAARFSGH